MTSRRKVGFVLYAGPELNSTILVLGPNTRAFNHVYDLAQDILQKTFGMELVELQSRAGLDKDANNANEDELNEARKATGVKKKGKRPLFEQQENT